MSYALAALVCVLAVALLRARRAHRRTAAALVTMSAWEGTARRRAEAAEAVERRVREQLLVVCETTAAQLPRPGVARALPPQARRITEDAPCRACAGVVLAEVIARHQVGPLAYVAPARARGEWPAAFVARWSDRS